ncbi:MAG: class I SAM-dependent methyltransferase [Bacteroidales bacterium]|nr:class I SAM-dependent methyltransferase [Bacteroidales bacterium]MCF8403243.1 class I SAM-dependent methyltransferase [Bacteroidales bacterium]
MNIFTRIIRKLQRIWRGYKPPEISSAVDYNSKQNINKLHQSFSYFKTTLNNSKDFVEIVYRFILSKNIHPEGLSIIDVGCGPGILLNKISKDFTTKGLTGLDFSETKIENCRKVFPHIIFDVHSIYDPYQGKFDFVVCTEVLEHLEYPEKAIRQLLNLLEPEANLLLTVPNGRTDTFAGHIHFWGPESWKLFLQKSIPETYKIEAGLFNFGKNNYAIISKKD